MATTAMKDAIADARSTATNGHRAGVVPAGGHVLEIPLELVDPAADNPRGSVGDVGELAQSIASVGLLEPIVVTPREERYLIVCGARRYAAVELAGMTTVTAIVRDYDEQERTAAMTVENLQREDLSVLEEAGAYAKLVELGLSQRELAKRVGKSQAHVSKRLSLLELPDPAREAVDSGGITLESAQELTKLQKLGADEKEIRDVVSEMRRLSKHGPQHERYPVEGAIRRREQQAKVDKLVADLERKGETVVRVPSSWQAPAGHALVGGWSMDAIQLEPAKHAKQPCHAVGVTPQGEKIELCNDPKRHPQERRQPEAAPRETKAQKAVRLHRDQLAAVAQARVSFLAELVAGKVTKDDVVAIALPAMFVVEPMLGTVARIFDIRQPEELDPVDGAEPAEPVDAAEYDYVGVEPDVVERALHERAAKSEAERLRVTFGVAAGIIEDLLGSPWAYVDWASLAGYFAILERHGYEISKAERAELDGKAPRA